MKNDQNPNIPDFDPQLMAAHHTDLVLEECSPQDIAPIIFALGRRAPRSHHEDKILEKLVDVFILIKHFIFVPEDLKKFWPILVGDSAWPPNTYLIGGILSQTIGFDDKFTDTYRRVIALCIRFGWSVERFKEMAKRGLANGRSKGEIAYIYKRPAETIDKTPMQILEQYLDLAKADAIGGKVTVHVLLHIWCEPDGEVGFERANLKSFKGMTKPRRRKSSKRARQNDLELWSVS